MLNNSDKQGSQRYLRLAMVGRRMARDHQRSLQINAKGTRSSQLKRTNR